MSSEKITVSAEDIDLAVHVSAPAEISAKKQPSPIPVWAKACLWLLVPVLPLLLVISVILRIAFRTQPPRTRYALVSLLATLLTVSSLLALVAGVAIYSLVPVPAMVNSGLPDLDQRTGFPSLSSAVTLTSAEVSSQLKPLVVVVSPAVRFWGRESASAGLGAGMLLEAGPDGYLFATANHVVNETASPAGGSAPHVMVAMEGGLWSRADVIATCPSNDMALLWVERHSGAARFVQPIGKPQDGEPIFVIGHPEGLKYTLSSGIISGLHEDVLQISAAISPGNSGGPVYDAHGSLLGVVSSKFDRNNDANAENLGFANSAELLHDLSVWSFHGSGRQRLEQYLKDLQTKQQM